MRHSAFGFVVLVILLVVVVMMLLTPHQRHSPSSSDAPNPLWGSGR
jgi:hypothetical protein